MIGNEQDWDDEDSNTKQHEYVFYYRNMDGDRYINTTFNFPDAVTHDEVVREFLNFLGAVYGYDLVERYLEK
jgi:hypothetical protein